MLLNYRVQILTFCFVLFYHQIYAQDVTLGLPKGSGNIEMLAISSDNELLVSYHQEGNDAFFKTWDIDTRKQINLIEKVSVRLTSISIKKNQYLIGKAGNNIGSSSDAMFYLWDLASGKLLFSHENENIQVIDNQEEIILLDAGNRWSDPKTFKIEDAEVVAHNLEGERPFSSGTGDYIIAGYEQEYLYDAYTGKLVATSSLSSDGEIFEKVACSPVSKEYLTLDYNNQVNVFQGSKVDPIYSFTIDHAGEEIEHIEYSQNGELLASTASNEIKLWDIKKGKNLVTLNNQYPANDLIFSKNNRYLLAINLSGEQPEGNANLYDIEKKKLIFNIPGYYNAYTFNDNEESLALYNSGDYGNRDTKTIDILDLPTLQMTHELETNNKSLVEDFFKSHREHANTHDASDLCFELINSDSDSYDPFDPEKPNDIVETYSGQSLPLSYILSKTGSMNLKDVELPIKWKQTDCSKLSKQTNNNFSMDKEEDRILYLPADKELVNMDVGSGPYAGTDKYLASYDFENSKIKIWDIHSNNLISIVDQSASQPFDLKFNPAGNKLLTSDIFDYAAIHSLEDGKLVMDLAMNLSPYGFNRPRLKRQFEFLNGEELLLDQAIQNTVKIKGLTSKPHKEPFIQSVFSKSISFDEASGRLMVASGYDSLKLEEYDIDDGTLHKLPAISIDEENRRILPSSNTIILLTEDNGKIAAWSFETLKNKVKKKKLLQFKASNSKLNNFSLSQNGQFLILPQPKAIHFWDLKSNKDFIFPTDTSSNVSTVAIQDDLLAISYENGPIELWSYDKRVKLASLENYGPANKIAINPQKSHVAFNRNDGSVILWDLKNPDRIIEQYILLGDANKWVHLTPGGFFDASPEAMELMYWVKGVEIIEFSQLKDRYWIPGLWEKVMKGETLPNSRGIDKLKLQPKVKTGMVLDQKIPVRLIKREGGYGKTYIYLNGKEISSDIADDPNVKAIDTTNSEIRFAYDFTNHPYLIHGKNKITIKSSSADGFVVGRGETVTFSHQKEEELPVQFFGVIVGVGDYVNDQINLKYTVNDAESVATAFELGSKNLFGKENTFIYNLNTSSDLLPTKENITDVFEEISNKARAEDIIVVYLSGHGLTWGGQESDFYFLTSDATAVTASAYNDPVIRSNTTVSTAEWMELLKEIPALKQVMIIDACGSGKTVDNLLAKRDIADLRIKAIDRLKDRMGMYIISGCAADAVSYEASQFGQGLLTYSLLQGMKGAALKEDQFIDVNTLFQFARDRVPVLAEGIGGIQKPQLLMPSSGSFDIGLVGTEDKKLIPLANPKRVFVRSTLVDAEEFEDILGISSLLDKELSAVSAKGIDSPLVFFDAREYPNACKITGGYNQDGSQVKLQMKLRCGEEQVSHLLEAANAEELIHAIIAVIK